MAVGHPAHGRRLSLLYQALRVPLAGHSSGMGGSCSPWSAAISLLVLLSYGPSSAQRADGGMFLRASRSVSFTPSPAVTRLQPETQGNSDPKMPT